jgi:hypothetical protein
MANKTKPEPRDVETFLATLVDEQQRRECDELIELARGVTGEPAVMWGPSIIGFGHFVMTYESGREVEWMRFGFSPRKATLVLYAAAGAEKLQPILDQLGPHKLGKSCIYLKRIAGLDRALLRELIRVATKDVDALRDSS